MARSATDVPEEEPGRRRKNLKTSKVYMEPDAEQTNQATQRHIHDETLSLPKLKMKPFVFLSSDWLI